MWFRLRFRANVAWTSAGVMTVPWGGPWNITVKLHYEGQGAEEEKLAELEGLKCEVSAQFQPSPQVQRIFQELRNAVRGKEADEDWYWDLRELPSFFRSFIQDMREQLSRPANRTIQLLRWRFDLYGSRQVGRQQAFEWSLDGNSWWPTPYDLRAGLDLYGEPINPSPALGETSSDRELGDL
jgi:hypothetical protein